MPPQPRLPPSLLTLLDATRAIVGEAPSAQMSIARSGGVVRAELLPPPLRAGVTAAIARALASTAEPLAGKDIEKLLKAAWRRPPAKVLDELDLDDPVAVRPHAQTHRGVLDGEPVAVKVARPRVAAAVRNDLVLLDALARPIGAAFPALDAGPLLRELRERTLDELDLEHEGEVHRRVARALRRVDGVEVARVDAELTTHDVHVSAFLDGPTLASGAAPDDPGAVARALVRVHLGAPRALGLVLANPRPSDVVLRPGGGIGLIGPGAARRVAPERLEGAIAAVEALQRSDPSAFEDALQTLELLPPDAARAAHAQIEAILGPLLLSGAATLDDAALAAAGTRALAAVGELMDLAGRGTPDPGDLWPARMLGQLAALLAPLGAEEDWLALGLGALREGWAPVAARTA